MTRDTTPVTGAGQFQEPLRKTLLRTGIISLVTGLAVAAATGNWMATPRSAVLALWPSFGGHWVEVFYLNWVRPRVGGAGWRRLARAAVWFAGGVVLTFGVRVTAELMFAARGLPGWLTWWVGGLGFVGIELVVHAVIRLGGEQGFYEGRG